VRLKRAVWPFLASVVVIGVLLVGVLPTRTYLAQRAALSRAAEQLDVLQDQNDQLGRRAVELRSDAEIERLARERYNLVRPGEETYAVTPPPGSATTTTAPSATAPPEDRGTDGSHDGNVLQRAWSRITSLF
jgi:hypothetical protein